MRINLLAKNLNLFNNSDESSEQYSEQIWIKRTDAEPGNAFQLKNPTTVQPTLPDRAAQTVKIKNSTFLSSGDEDKDKSS